MTERNNVYALEQAIMEMAQQEVQTILSEAQTQAESIHKQADVKAEVERNKVVQAAQKEVDILVSQATSKAQLEAQMLKLQRRERLLEHTFAQVREQLASITERPDYTDIVQRLIREATTYLGEETLTVHADPKTQTLLTAAVLNELARELNVSWELGTPLDNGTGIVLAAAGGHRRYDNTLEARLTRQQDSLRSAVYHILAQDASLTEDAT
jgi:vacuolar-type H+-ATPase subunit E/Vma4